MAVELKVPHLGMDMQEARIVAWKLEEGAAVEKGQPVLEIETDKAVFEVEAPIDGRLVKRLHPEDSVVPVGEVLALIAESDAAERTEVDEIAATADEVASGAPEPAPVSTNPVATSPAAPSRDLAGAPSPAEPPVIEAAPPRVAASPAARRMAMQHGVALETVRGSGPAGRAYAADVLGALRAPVRPESTPESPTEQRLPLSRIRRLGAERTARSFAQAPHFYLRRDMQAARLIEVQERLAGQLDPAPAFNDLLTFAVARTLRNHPRVNGRYDEGELVVHPQVNLGIAVATDEGLVVPVLHGADGLGLRAFVASCKALIGRARAGRLAPTEVTGGTFTVSNLGMMGIDSFDAVINPPEAAILAVGRLRTVPEWRDGAWIPVRVFSTTLSVDHRAADGADGARFLSDLQEVLLEWTLLL